MMVNNEYNAGNKRFYQYCNLDEMHLMGFVDRKKYDLAVDEYIMMNQMKLIRPYMKMRDSKNKPLYTVDKATDEVKKRLLETYTTFK
jgi:hypothetical protein